MRKLLLIVFMLLGLFSCFGKFDKYSYQAKTNKEKLKIFSQYYFNNEGLIDVEYHLQHRRTFMNRRTDMNYTMALKVQKESIDSYLKKIHQIALQISTDQWKELKLDTNTWKLNTTPELYVSDNLQLVNLVYREEGIVLIRYNSQKPIRLDTIEIDIPHKSIFSETP